MIREDFVQNIKFFCERKGVKPTAACREAGVGSSFVTDIKRGQTPSVEKVQLLAQYLGVTVSELIGEKTPPPSLQPAAGLTEAEHALIVAYRAADDRARNIVDLTLEPFRRDQLSEDNAG